MMGRQQRKMVVSEHLQAGAVPGIAPVDKLDNINQYCECKDELFSTAASQQGFN